MTAQPGWYTDPQNSAHVRWWDGSSWTEHTQPHPNRQAAQGSQTTKTAHMSATQSSEKEHEQSTDAISDSHDAHVDITHRAQNTEPAAAPSAGSAGAATLPTSQKGSSWTTPASAEPAPSQTIDGSDQTKSADNKPAADTDSAPVASTPLDAPAGVTGQSVAAPREPGTGVTAESAPDNATQAWVSRFGQHDNEKAPTTAPVAGQPTSAASFAQQPGQFQAQQTPYGQPVTDQPPGNDSVDGTAAQPYPGLDASSAAGVLASRGKRFGAFLIDYFLLSALSSVLLLTVFKSQYDRYNADLQAFFVGDLTTSELSAAAGGLLGYFLASTALIFAYYVVTQSAWGATLGKKILGIKLVSADGNKLSVGRVILRELVRAITLFIFWPLTLLETAWCLWDSKVQCVHDKAGKTVVIEKK